MNTKKACLLSHTATHKKYAVEIIANVSPSENSSIVSDDSANYQNGLVSRFGLEQHLDNEDDQEIAFDLSQQVTLHIGADCGGILGNASGDSGTVRTDCSAATLVTTKDYLEPPINILLAHTVIPNQNLALAGSLSVSQAADQPTGQVHNQLIHQLDHHSTSQSDLQAQPPSNPLQQLNSPTAPSITDPV